jgi:hypothetical protein
MRCFDLTGYYACRPYSEFVGARNFIQDESGGDLVFMGFRNLKVTAGEVVEICGTISC